MENDINKIRLAGTHDKEEVAALYQSLIGMSGCSWTSDYPTMEDVVGDIEKESLYVICHDNKIIAAAAAAEDDELADLQCWSADIKKPCGLARIGVRKECQNQGIAKELIRYIEKAVKEKGFDGVHLSVSKCNELAKRFGGTGRRLLQALKIIFTGDFPERKRNYSKEVLCKIMEEY